MKHWLCICNAFGFAHAFLLHSLTALVLSSNSIHQKSHLHQLFVVLSDVLLSLQLIFAKVGHPFFLRFFLRVFKASSVSFCRDNRITYRKVALCMFVAWLCELCVPYAACACCVLRSYAFCCSSRTHMMSHAAPHHCTFSAVASPTYYGHCSYNIQLAHRSDYRSHVSCISSNTL